MMGSKENYATHIQIAKWSIFHSEQFTDYLIGSLYFFPMFFWRIFRGKVWPAPRSGESWSRMAQAGEPESMCLRIVYSKWQTNGQGKPTRLGPLIQLIQGYTSVGELISWTISDVHRHLFHCALRLAHGMWSKIPWETRILEGASRLNQMWQWKIP